MPEIVLTALKSAHSTCLMQSHIKLNIINTNVDCFFTTDTEKEINILINEINNT